MDNQAWIFSSNPQVFDLDSAFAERDNIYWHTNSKSKVQVGDTVFLYISKPQQEIRFKTRVTAVNVPYINTSDIKKYWIHEEDYQSLQNELFYQLKLISAIRNKGEELSYAALKDNLHLLSGPIMGPIKAQNELLAYLEGTFLMRGSPVEDNVKDSIRFLQKKVTEFRDERDWKQFHTPKDLAISISLEAAELLEIFQWSGADLEVNNKRSKIEEELADVIMYCLSLAEVTGLEIGEIVLKKLALNNAKYPVDKSYGKADKYTEL